MVPTELPGTDVADLQLQYKSWRILAD